MCTSLVKSPLFAAYFSYFWFSVLYVYNGNIEIRHGHADHQALNYYSHPVTKGLNNISLGFVHYYNLNISCEIPQVAIFSADGWWCTGGDALLNACNVGGVGSLRYVGNGDIALSDLKVAKRNVKFDAGFTNN